MASVYNMEIDQGSDYFLLVTLNKDLTGRQLRGQIRFKTSDPAPQSAFVFTMVDALIGKFYVKLPGESSSLMKMPSQGVAGSRVKALMIYDIESYISAADEDPARELEGTVTVNPEATK